MNAMRLTIASLKGIQFEGQAASLNVKTASGEITVLDHHRPLITVLKSGPVIIKDWSGETTRLEIRGGFLEVGQKNELYLLAD